MLSQLIDQSAPNPDLYIKYFLFVATYIYYSLRVITSERKSNETLVRFVPCRA